MRFSLGSKVVNQAELVIALLVTSHERLATLSAIKTSFDALQNPYRSTLNLKLTTIHEP